MLNTFQFKLNSNSKFKSSRNAPTYDNESAACLIGLLSPLAPVDPSPGGPLGPVDPVLPICPVNEIN